VLHATLEVVLPRTYDNQNCSIARTLELVGERWTMLVLREAFLGRRRFDEYAERLGIARNVLSARLARLVEEGVLAKVRYQERPERFEYRLTEKGLDLRYGDRHYAPDGPPMVVTHRGCGGELTDRRACARCGAELTVADVQARPGPGAVLSAAAPAAG
jgi:DNA-binding HxlR family transcriptional regulator